MSTHGQFANPLTPSQPQSPCKLFIQPLFGGRFFLLQLTPGRQANLGLRLYKRPSAVAFVIGLRTTMRKTAEERFHTLTQGWLAYPVTPRTHIYRRRAVVDVDSWPVCKSIDSLTTAITLQIIYITALRRLQRHPPRHISSRSFLGCKLTVDGGRFRMATKKRDNTLRVVSPYNSI